MSNQSLIRSRDLCKALGDISRQTLCDWVNERPELKACQFKRGWFYIQKLRDAGFLLRREEPPK